MPLKAGILVLKRGLKVPFPVVRFAFVRLSLANYPKKGMGFFKIKLVVYSLWQNKTLLFSFEMNTNLIEVGHFPSVDSRMWSLLSFDQSLASLFDDGDSSSLARLDNKTMKQHATVVINLLDEILLIRLVDLFQRVVAFVRKVKTTSQYLIDSKGNADAIYLE